MYTGPCNWRQLHFFSFFLSAFPFAIILYFLYNSKTKAMKTFAIHQLTNNVCKCAFKHDIFFLTSSPFFRFCSVAPVQTTRHYFWHYWMRPISTDTNLIPSAQVYHFRRKFMNRDFWREYVKYTNFAYVLARTHTFIVHAVCTQQWRCHRKTAYLICKREKSFYFIFVAAWRLIMQRGRYWILSHNNCMTINGNK